MHFTAPMHGIYRKIPIFDQNNNRISIENVQVVGGEAEVFSQDGSLYIRIGSPSMLVEGDKNYQIDYQVYGAIHFFSDHSEFYWNLIGTDWGVPIHTASFNVLLPESLKLEPGDYFVYTGPAGSRGNNVRYSYQDKSLSGKIIQQLNPSEGITAGIKFPQGYLQKSIPFGVRLRQMPRIFASAGLLVIPFSVAALLYFVWRSFGENEKVPDMVFYKPPEDLTPAEAGVLADNRTDNRDLISLIYYWAGKGLLTIQEVESSGILGLLCGKDYVLKKTMDLPADAKPYEVTMFYGLFLPGQSEVQVSSLKNKFYKVMNDARGQLDDCINQESLYVPGTREGRTALYVIGGIFVYFLSKNLHNISIDYLIPLFMTAGVFFLFGYLFPTRSQTGLKKYEVLRGFKEFVEKAEAPRLEALLKQDPNYFDKTLAYAIALGVSSVWAEKFKDLITAPPSWCTGYPGGNFSTINFVNSLNSSVSGMNSAFSSGGGGSFGGGGSSGGGGGGGGGGGW